MISLDIDENEIRNAQPSAVVLANRRTKEEIEKEIEEAKKV